MAQRFYVVETHHGAEQVALMNLLNQGYEVFMPTVAVATLDRKRQPTESIRPVFSGYAFVRFDIENTRWRSINGTRGVKRILGEGEAPTAIPEGVIEDIQARYAAGHFQRTIDFDPNAIGVGDKGRVNAGFFQDTIGTCLEVLPGRVKLAVINFAGAMLEMFFPSQLVVRAHAT